MTRWKGETGCSDSIGRSRLREVGRAVGEKFILCKEFRGCSGTSLYLEIPAKLISRRNIVWVGKKVLFGKIFTHVKSYFVWKNVSQVQMHLRPSISSRLHFCDSACDLPVPSYAHFRSCAVTLSHIFVTWPSSICSWKQCVRITQKISGAWKQYLYLTPSK